MEGVNSTDSLRPVRAQSLWTVQIHERAAFVVGAGGGQ